MAGEETGAVEETEEGEGEKGEGEKVVVREEVRGVGTGERVKEGDWEGMEKEGGSGTLEDLEELVVGLVEGEG